MKDDGPTKWEVWDAERGTSAVFDSAGAEAWGPVFGEEDWTPGEDCFAFRVETTLYRHTEGHWTLIGDYVFQLAPAPPFLPEAKRLTDAAAVEWLTRNGFDPPADVAQLAGESYFKPGPPVPRPVEPGAAADAIKPWWDAERRELRYGNKVVKRYRQPAENQCLLLAAFEESGWPPRIDDPIPPKGGTDPRERLRDTVRALNAKCSGLHFELDGTSKAVIWNAAPDADAAPESGDDLPF